MAYEPAVDEAAPAAPLEEDTSEEEATPPLRVTVASAAGSPPLSVAVPGDARRRGRKTSVPDQQFGVRALVPTTAPAGPKRAHAGEVPWASPIGPLRAEREALEEMEEAPRKRNEGDETYHDKLCILMAILLSAIGSYLISTPRESV